MVGSDNMGVVMEDKTGGQAFPFLANQGFTESTEHLGMTLRDYFAASALQGIIAAHAGPDINLPMAYKATTNAYEYADAMLAVREK